MSKFKVGDRVRRVVIENSGLGWCLPVSATATIAVTNENGEVGVKNCAGAVGPVPEACIMLESFFELVQEPAKQAAKAGGLQEHSLGDCYPYAVVGYDNGGKTTFVVENLQTGDVAVRYGKLVAGNAEDACKVQRLAASWGWLAGWSSERPCFIGGELSLPSDPSTLYATELASQEAKLNRKLTPREQYQLAMEIGKE